MNINGVDKSKLNLCTPKTILHNLYDFTLSLGKYKMPVEEMIVVAEAVENFDGADVDLVDGVEVCPICKTKVAGDEDVFCRVCGKKLIRKEA